MILEEDEEDGNVKDERREKEKVKTKEHQVKEAKKIIRTLLNDMEQYVDEKTVSGPPDESQAVRQTEADRERSVGAVHRPGSISCEDLERELLCSSETLLSPNSSNPGVEARSEEGDAHKEQAASSAYHGDNQCAQLQEYSVHNSAQVLPAFDAQYQYVQDAYTMHAHGMQVPHSLPFHAFCAQSIDSTSNVQDVNQVVPCIDSGSGYGQCLHMPSVYHPNSGSVCMMSASTGMHSQNVPDVHSNLSSQSPASNPQSYDVSSSLVRINALQ